jgi:DNA-nicking Smr family endonuclease
MTRSTHKSNRSGKRLVTADEVKLWQYATRSLDPIKAKPRVSRAAAPTQPTSTAALSPVRSSDPSGLLSSDRSLLRSTDPAAPRQRAKVSPAGASRAKVATARGGPPPLAHFDRRQARQIASGRVEVDARIDLHGLYQREAYARLRAFLTDAHARALRRVLVITGKGGAQPPDRPGELAGERRRGVLRHSLPHWLEEPELRSMVASFTQAGVRHGGAGAFYVQLRRGR